MHRAETDLRAYLQMQKEQEGKGGKEGNLNRRKKNAAASTDEEGRCRSWHDAEGERKKRKQRGWRRPPLPTGSGENQMEKASHRDQQRSEDESDRSTRDLAVIGIEAP
jgi:hypothetical protein